MKTSCTIKLSEFSCLYSHQLASVLHRLHPREKMTPPNFSSSARLKSELMVELHRNAVARMRWMIFVVDASTRFQFSMSLNNSSVLNWVQFSSFVFSFQSGQISGGCQEAFTRNDDWDGFLQFFSPYINPVIWLGTQTIHQTTKLLIHLLSCCKAI